MLTDQLQDMVSGLKYLRGRKNVDANRIAIVGHSFGGSLTFLVVEHDPRLKAAVVFSGGGYSWDLFPPLRERLIIAVKNISAHIMIIHDQNDYSTSPGYAMHSVMITPFSRRI